MRIVAFHSHLNGWEYIKVHKPGLWSEIEEVIARVDAEKCRTKKSKEKRTHGKMLYSPIAMNEAMDTAFSRHKWKQQITRYWVTEDADLIEKTLKLPPPNRRNASRQRGNGRYHPTIKQTL